MRNRWHILSNSTVETLLAEREALGKAYEQSRKECGQLRKANSELDRQATVADAYQQVAYTYEINRDLMTAIDNRISGSSYSNYAYSHDALGRRTSREQSGSAFALTHTDTFAYNTRSEVTGSTNSVLTGSAYTPTYTYDKIGNRESSTGISAVSAYTANQLNQYTAIGATNPTYDADGNLTSNGTWTYSWNGENRLRTATKGTTTINFTYDYLGRLVKKDDGTNTQVYVYDGWHCIATFGLLSSTLTLQTTYLWGLDLSGTLQGAGGVGGLLKEGANYVLYDANGNIVQKLNGTGTAVMNVDYDPFGNIIRGTLTGDYGFSTKPLIDQIDWYYYGFRYYDPVTGRWPSRDPIEELGANRLNISFSLLVSIQEMREADFINSYNKLVSVYVSRGDFRSFIKTLESYVAVSVLLSDLAHSKVFRVRGVNREIAQALLQNARISSYMFIGNASVSLIDILGLFRPTPFDNGLYPISETNPFLWGDSNADSTMTTGTNWPSLDQWQNQMNWLDEWASESANQFDDLADDLESFIDDLPLGPLGDNLGDLCTATLGLADAAITGISTLPGYADAAGDLAIGMVDDVVNNVSNWFNGLFD